MHKRSVTFFLLGLFLLSLASPLATPASTQGRSSPNLSVQLISLDNAGSINNGTHNLVQDSATHSVVVIVKNKGGLEGSGTLRLLHKGSPSADPVQKGTHSVSNLAAGATTSPIVFSWTGTLGDGQTLIARIDSVADSDLSDNEQSLFFDVVDYIDASFSEQLANPLPSVNPGETTARISKDMNYFNISISNQGVDTFTAELEATLTPYAAGPLPVTFVSGQENMNPRSLYDVHTGLPQVTETLSASYDFTGGSFVGDWNLTLTLKLYNGLDVETITVLEIDVTFSNLAVVITPAQDRTTEPGLTTTLTYMLQNIGDPDNFNIIVADVLGWVGTSPSSTGMFSSSTTVDISVTVPSTAARSEVESVTVTFTSATDPTYTIQVTTKVMAGESYGVLVTMPSTVTMLIPGKPSTVNVTINNTGNAPTTFLLSTGLTAPAVNWNLELNAQETATVPSNGEIIVSVEVTPPAIKKPINPNEYNRAGDVLSVWVMATAARGGVPHQDSSPLEIKPVLTVDPGLEMTDVYLTPEEVRQAKQGQGIDIILDLEIQARHNLITNLDGTIDSTVTIGDIVFETASTGGADEKDRWSIPPPSPSSFIDMSLNEIYFASIGIQGPASDYPVAGVLEIPVTTSPTLGAGFPAGIEASDIDTVVRVHIPAVDEVDILQTTPLEVSVGEANTFDIELANFGNNQTSYRLTLVDELPLDWTGSFANGSVLQIMNLSNVRAAVADYPDIEDNHISTFPITVTPADDAPANSIEHVTIVVENLKTGQFISSHAVEFIVKESIDLEVDPSSQLVNLSVGESVVTRVKISNTGNTQTLFNLWLDDSSSDEVSFEIETSDSVLVGSGFDSTVKVRLTASSTARADVEYKATLWVESPASGLNVSADIIANISENHGIDIDPDITQIAVIPGTQEEITFNITNLGNLAENVRLVINHSDDWDIDDDIQNIPLSIEEVFAGSFVMTIPGYDGSESMLNGATHTITLTAFKGNEDFVLDQETIEVIIAPKFIPEFENWPSEVEFNARDTRTWNVIITNKGNKDVTVDIDYALFEAGLSTPSTQFQLGADAPESLFLPKDFPVTLAFSIISTELEPDLTDAAELVLTVTPAESGVTGSGQQITTLSMSRFFERQNEIFSPVGNDNVEKLIRYSHIPSGVALTVEYEIELCRSNRLIDLDDLNLNESTYPWTFTLDIDGELFPLNLTARCSPSASLGEDNRVTLPPINPYATDSFKVIINPPNRPNLLSGDGWDLEFRLYHPDENAGYTVYDSDIFTFKLDDSADPGYQKIFIDNDLGAMEGKEVVVSAVIVNFGTAQAIGVLPTLTCDAADVITQAGIIPILNDSDVITVEWIIIPHTMNWYETVAPIDCKASLTAFQMEGNIGTNDVIRLEDVDRISASPDVAIAFGAFIALLLLAFVFSRLKSQSEQWGHFSTYATVLALGFAFYLMNIEYYGYGILAISALWIWRSAWKSGEEFRLIHEDYQRARKGNATVYADHFQALKDGRKQLTIILALPVLGLYAVILGIPPQLPDDNRNLGFLAAYFVFVAFGVWYLLRRSDKIYGNLYGRLTDVEVKSVRLDRDLRDPARLLNELADDGIDFEKFFEPANKPKPTMDASSGNNSTSLGESEQDIEEGDIDG